MHEVGFEPTKLPHEILSLAPLTTRESVLIVFKDIPVIYREQVLILRPLGYEPNTLPLRHPDTTV